MHKIGFYFKKYTWLVVLLAVGVGLFCPGFGLFFQKYVPYLLMVLMFLGCLNMDLGRSVKHLKKIRKVLLSLFVIHLGSALLVLVCHRFFSDEIFLGLIIATAAPVGVSVVFLSDLYGGSKHKSLVIAFLSNILCPLLFPFVVHLLAGRVIEIDWMSIFWKIFVLVVIPVGLAILLQKTSLDKVLSHNGTFFSVAALFFLVVGVISPVSAVVMANLGLVWWLMGFVTVLVLLNFGVGFWLGSDYKAKVTYAIVLSYKNFSLAMVIALSMFGPMVALPAVVYTLVNNLLLIPLQLVFVKVK